MMDVARLLEPIPGPSPCGRDLRSKSRAAELFDAQDALYKARAAGEGGAGRLPGWAKAAEACETILTAHSKDLEAAAGAVEAWTGSNGLAGLAAGGALLRSLIDAYWSDLYPAPPPDEPATAPETVRMLPLQQLQADPRRLPALLRRLTLLVLEDGTPVSVSQALSLKGGAAIPAAEKERWDKIVPQFRSEADLVDLGLVDLSSWGDLLAAMAAWRELETTIQALMPGQAFSCGATLDLLADIQRLIRPTGGAKATADAVAGPTQAAVSASPAAITGASSTSIASREAALQQLATISAYFRINEPFSPVSNILDEAIRRARLGWLEWITEVIPDPRQRETVLSSLGLRASGP